MKTILRLLIAPLLLLCFLTQAQVKKDSVWSKKQSPQIEILPYSRWDSYPEFSYVLNGRPSTDYVKINGTGWGIYINYKLPVAKSIFIKSGIGYYKYSFNNIKKENTQFGKSTVRDIDYYSGPIAVDILYYTDKYWYNTINANIGVEKLFNLKKDMQITTALNINNYFTFSQYYHLSYNSPGSQDYKKNIGRYFGSSVNINASLLKKFTKISIGPSIIIPVFELWKTDETFFEETNSGSRNKWFRGIGLGISCNYSLTKK
jgi:hypothetical protein